MPLHQLETLSWAGSEAKPNEDRFAAGERFALVVDGATGLGEGRLRRDFGSDAAWLAERAAHEFAARLPGDAAVADIARAFCAASLSALEAALGPDALAATPRYAWPTAGFQCLRERLDGALETAGLGDCALFLLDADGAFLRASGQASRRGVEQAAARAALALVGGLTSDGLSTRRPEVLARLRDARLAHNTPGGAVWTLGLEPAAADHVVARRLAPTRPAAALLATDGFADLVDHYGLYDGPGLVRAAEREGLAALARKLRDVEERVDPTGARYPRFKRSDDATAILLRLD